MRKREHRQRPLEEQHAAFEMSLSNGGYGHDLPCWPHYINSEILSAYSGKIGGFAKSDWLNREDFVARIEKIHPVGAMLSRDGMPDGHSIWQSFKTAGNIIHWGVKLGLLAECEVDGIRGWRILDWEPHWAVETSRRGAQLIRLKGGDPEEQATRAAWQERKARSEKRSETQDRKARAAFCISNPLNTILESDRGYVVPPTWASRGPMPGWTVGRELRAVFGVALEAHQLAGLTKLQLIKWAALVDDGRIAAATRAQLSVGQPRLPFATEPELHPDDVEALARLADLRSL